MPLFQVSQRAQQRNERFVAAIYVVLLAVLVGGFALAVVGGFAARLLQAL